MKKYIISISLILFFIFSIASENAKSVGEFLVTDANRGSIRYPISLIVNESSKFFIIRDKETLELKESQLSELQTALEVFINSKDDYSNSYITSFYSDETLRIIFNHNRGKYEIWLLIRNSYNYASSNNFYIMNKAQALEALNVIKNRNKVKESLLTSISDFKASVKHP